MTEEIGYESYKWAILEVGIWKFGCLIEVTERDVYILHSPSTLKLDITINGNKEWNTVGELEHLSGN